MLFSWLIFLSEERGRIGVECGGRARRTANTIVRIIYLQRRYAMHDGPLEVTLGSMVDLSGFVFD